LLKIQSFTFDLLRPPPPGPSTKERAEVKRVARELPKRLNQLLAFNWRQKSSVRLQITFSIEGVFDTGLLRAYNKPLYEQKCSDLFESYSERDAGVDNTAA